MWRSKPKVKKMYRAASEEYEHIFDKFWRQHENVARFV
jgi:hypothetical protein